MNLGLKETGGNENLTKGGIFLVYISEIFWGEQIEVAAHFLFLIQRS